MYKLIAIDIDGTLLNSQGELTRRTIDTISRVSNQNVKIVLTSGRVTTSVKAIAEKIHADNLIICDNGASIYDRDTQKTIWSKEISKKTVIDFIDVCEKNDIYYMVFTDDQIVVKNLKHMALVFYMQRHNCVDENSGISQFKYGGLEYISKIEKPIRRIVVSDDDRVIYNSIVNKLKFFPNVSLMASPFVSHKVIMQGDKKVVLSYSYAEILPSETNKWVAINQIIDRLHINPSEVMAIGDNFNDVSMIQNAGLGVAMNNGAKVAKDVAMVIAPSNNEDGVAVALEQYVLKNNN